MENNKYQPLNINITPNPPNLTNLPNLPNWLAPIAARINIAGTTNKNLKYVNTGTNKPIIAPNINGPNAHRINPNRQSLILPIRPIRPICLIQLIAPATTNTQKLIINEPITICANTQSGHGTLPVTNFTATNPKFLKFVRLNSAHTGLPAADIPAESCFNSIGHHGIV